VFPGEDFVGSLHMQHDMLQRKPAAMQSSFGTATLQHEATGNYKQEI
jgi:hypothetical protein